MEDLEKLTINDIKTVLNRIAKKNQRREDSVIDIKNDEKLKQLKSFQNILFKKLMEKENETGKYVWYI